VGVREVINAVRYLVRSGCGWRMLPIHFGAWQTAYGWFRELARRFFFQTIRDVELMLDRERYGREASPSPAVIDSQSITTCMPDSTACQSRLIDNSRLPPRSAGTPKEGDNEISGDQGQQQLSDTRGLEQDIVRHFVSRWRKQRTCRVRARQEQEIDQVLDHVIISALDQSDEAHRKHQDRACGDARPEDTRPRASSRTGEIQRLPNRGGEYWGNDGNMESPWRLIDDRTVRMMEAGRCQHPERSEPGKAICADRNFDLNLFGHADSRR